MKALLLKQYQQLELTDMPAPEVGDHDVLIRVAACGVCGSDIHGFDGSSGRRIPPLVMGHEAAGTIAAVGEQVGGWAVGERVTFDSMVFCGDCHFCHRGQSNLCDNRMVLGVSCGDYRRHGAFAEFVVVPQHNLFRLPEELSFEMAALIEPVGVAVHAANRTSISLGDTAVVVGSGMIGLLVIQAFRLAGCLRIIAVDLDDDRLEIAKQVGADVGLNAREHDVPAEVAALTSQRGADVAVEVVGTSETVKTAVESVRKGGHLTLVGNLSPQVELPLQSVVTRELTVYGTCGSCGEYSECIDLVAQGKIDVAPVISAVAPLEEGPAWFDRLYRAEPGLMKVILKP